MKKQKIQILFKISGLLKKPYKLFGCNSSYATLKKFDEI